MQWYSFRHMSGKVTLRHKTAVTLRKENHLCILFVCLIDIFWNNLCSDHSQLAEK